MEYCIAQVESQSTAISNHIIKGKSERYKRAVKLSTPGMHPVTGKIFQKSAGMSVENIG